MNNKKSQDNNTHCCGFLTVTVIYNKKIPRPKKLIVFIFSFLNNY